MNIREHHARLHRHQRDSAAWKLLCAENAPLILAYVADLFAKETEVPFGRARVALDEELASWREAGLHNSETAASGYLRSWIGSGWLRELDGQLSQTDACEVALRFCNQLEYRDTNATASHLRIVQDTIRDLAVDLSMDPDARARVIQARIDTMQLELDALAANVIHELPEHEQRERIREVYQLASVLTSDFRRMEDEVRTLDHGLRVEMIESGAMRGGVLRGLLDREEGLADSDAGRAFNGFFSLLRDPDRSTELREQLKAILNSTAAKHLAPAQAHYLAHLLRELNRESERVLRVRRRIEESLRAFVENSAHEEHRAVSRLLAKLERRAVRFVEHGVNLNTDTRLALNSGRARMRSPASLRLQAPEEKLDTSDVTAARNRTGPSDAMLDQLDSVKAMEIAHQIRDKLDQSGPATIAKLIEALPVRAGLEELVAFLRVAQAVGATRLPDSEAVVITDMNGTRLKASIPHYLLSAEWFPQRMEDLVL